MIYEALAGLGAVAGTGFVLYKTVPVEIGTGNVGVRRNRFTGSLTPILDRSKIITQSVAVVNPESGRIENQDIPEVAPYQGITFRLPFVHQIIRLPSSLIEFDPDETNMPVTVFDNGLPVPGAVADVHGAMRVVPEFAGEVVSRIRPNHGETITEHVRGIANTIGKSVGFGVANGQSTDNFIGPNLDVLRASALTEGRAQLARYGCGGGLTLQTLEFNTVRLPDEYTKRIAEASADRVGMMLMGEPTFQTALLARNGNTIVVDGTRLSEAATAAMTNRLNSIGGGEAN